MVRTCNDKLHRLIPHNTTADAQSGLGFGTGGKSRPMFSDAQAKFIEACRQRSMAPELAETALDAAARAHAGTDAPRSPQQEPHAKSA